MHEDMYNQKEEKEMYVHFNVHKYTCTLKETR